MRDRLRIIFVFFVVLLLSARTVYAIDDIDLINTLDWSFVEKFFNELPLEYKSFFNGDIKTFIENFSQSSETISLEKFKTFIFPYLFSSLKTHISLFVIVALIIISSSFFKTIKPEFASNSVSRIVDFSVTIIIGSILSFSVLNFIKSINVYVKTISNLIQVFFPLILTLLSTIGATTSSVSFHLSASIFVNALISIIISIVLPITILGLAFSIISTIKTGNSNQSFVFSLLNFAKKSVRALFFIFTGFISLQGISVSVKDTVGVRIARFSLSKYVPLIGGYLSEGFNYLYAGSILLKNSIGVSFIILLCLISLPILIEVLICHILLKLSATLSGAMSENRLTRMFGGVAKCASLLITCIVCVSVCLIIFVSIIILSCNSVL